MMRFIFYLFLFYFIFYLARYVIKIYKLSRQGTKPQTKPAAEVKQKSDIDKNKIIDAQYEEL